MEEDKLDIVLVPMGLLLMAIYHSWLLFTLLNSPKTTVIGLNAESRHQWVHAIMTDAWLMLMKLVYILGVLGFMLILWMILVLKWLIFHSIPKWAGFEAA